MKGLQHKGVRYAFIGIITNFILAVIKGMTGYFGHSYALIADAIESSSDILSSLMVFVGLTYALKAPDKRHPYGHGKAEPLTGIVVSVFLFFAAILISINSVKLILTPHQTPKFYTLYVLGAVIIFKEFLFRKIIKSGNELESVAIKADAWHHRSDALSSLAAFIGILIAIIGGRGYESADDWAALFAAGIIIFNGVMIFVPALNEIMDAAPPERVTEQIREIASKVDGVVEIEKCFVRKMGFDYFVDIHVIVKGDIPVREGHRIAHLVKDLIMQEKNNVSDVLVHIEPDSF